MAMLDFIACGGDGYSKINRHPSYVDSGFVDIEVLKGFIEKYAPLNVIDYALNEKIINR